MPVVMQTMEQVADETMPRNVVELHVTGKLHKADYEEIWPNIEQLIAAHGKLRLLVTLIDFHGWDLAAFWEDVKLDIRHFRDFERIAVVGQTGGEHVMTELFKPFTAATMKYFDVDQLREARQWIAARM